MNYSPVNQQGLLGLIQALKAGLDPSTAYSVFQGIQSDQAQRIAQRQERVSSLTDLLTQNAAQGATYQQAHTLADLAPGPMGPAVENILSTLYPAGPPSQGRLAGLGLTEKEAMAQGITGKPVQTSPMYAPAPQSPQDQIQLQLGQMQLQDELGKQQAAIQTATSFADNIKANVDQGMSPEQVLNSYITDPAMKTSLGAMLFDPVFQSVILKIGRDAQSAKTQAAGAAQSQAPASAEHGSVYNAFKETPIGFLLP